MGAVTDAVGSLVRRLVERYGLVVWLDPERAYTGALPRVDLGTTPLLAFDGSFFALRNEMERYLDKPERPRLVVYVPLTEDEIGGALCECMAAAKVVRPGTQPWTENTRLSVVARPVLAPKFPADELERLLKEVDAGKLTLDDLDEIARRGAQSPVGALSIVFGTTVPSQIALLFLSSAERDAAIIQKGAVADLAARLDELLDSGTQGVADLADLRLGVARAALRAELVAVLGDRAPRALTEARRPRRADAVDAAISVASSWRNQREGAEVFAQHADTIERELGLDPSELPLEDLKNVQSLRSFELALQHQVARRLLDEPSTELVSLASHRRSSFWAAREPGILEGWLVLGAIGRVLVEAGRVEAALRRAPASVGDIARMYTAGDSAEPWCALDTAHRQMENLYHQSDVGVRPDDTLEQLIARARQRHTAVAEALAERFTRGIVAAKLELAGTAPQRQVYDRHVRRRRREGRRVGYVLVDALRYEMARELVAGIEEPKKTLEYVVGTLPSITEVGMAALMPGAEAGIELVAAEGGRVAIAIGESVLRVRDDRVAHLQRTEPGAVVVRLDELVPPSRAVRNQISSPGLVVVTATDELDGLCEKGNVSMARRVMDGVLLQLRRAIRVLFDAGVDVVVITADHGYLFGEALDAGRKMDPPGGQTVDLHRRAWVGRGGAVSSDYLRFKASDVGLQGDLEIAVPVTLGCFRAPGRATAYFHGGASPQELLVPVCTFERPDELSLPSSELALRVTMGSKAVSTRFVSVLVEGEARGLFQVDRRPVRVELRDAKQPRFRAVSATYGLDDATGIVVLETAPGGRMIRPNTITLMMVGDDVPTGTLSLIVHDATTDAVLANIPRVPVSMTRF